MIIPNLIIHQKTHISYLTICGNLYKTLIKEI